MYDTSWGTSRRLNQLCKTRADARYSQSAIPASERNTSAVYHTSRQSTNSWQMRVGSWMRVPCNSVCFIWLCCLCQSNRPTLIFLPPSASCDIMLTGILQLISISTLSFRPTQLGHNIAHPLPDPWVIIIPSTDLATILKLFCSAILF